MADNKEMVGITRIIEYYGPKEWIEQIIANSRVPLHGQINYDKLANGAYIKSGVVMWSVQPVVKVDTADLTPNKPADKPDIESEPETINIVDQTKLKPFPAVPRPGGRG